MFRLLVLFFILILSGCGDFTPTINSENQEVSGGQPDLLVNDFKTSSFEKEKRTWFIKSETAKVYDKKKETDMDVVNFITYNSDQTPATFIVADLAVLNNETRNVTLKENVIIINNEGTEITGDLFFWDNKERTFSSPNRVKVKKSDGSVISGVGFSSNQQLGNIEFKSDVSGELSSSEEDDFFEGF